MMVPGSRWVNGKEMRRGVTTGSCAAAAAKAAAQMLFTGSQVNRISIDLPAGMSLELDICEISYAPDQVTCCVIKDAGDDPDITNGLKIFTTAREAGSGISLKAGEGIGVVTKPGLPVAVGQPAINPVPRRMIVGEVEKVLPPGKGVEITVFVPDGRRLSDRTFNPRLGIWGGLSILGTSGLVEPMSQEAWKDTMVLELQVLAGQGMRRIILVPGNYGERFVREGLGLKGEPLVKISNFVGDAVQTAAGLGFREILLVSEIGKLIKAAAGIFLTHSRMADARMEIMAGFAALLGAEQEVIKKIFSAYTTGEALEYLDEAGIQGFSELVVARASQRLKKLAGESALGVVMFSHTRGLLALDETAKLTLGRLHHE